MNKSCCSFKCKKKCSSICKHGESILFCHKKDDCKKEDSIVNKIVAILEPETLSIDVSNIKVLQWMIDNQPGLDITIISTTNSFNEIQSQISQGTKYMIACSTSKILSSCLSLLQDNNIVLISLYSTAANLTAPSTIRLSLTDDKMTVPINAFTTQQSFDKIIMFYDPTDQHAISFVALYPYDSYPITDISTEIIPILQPIMDTYTKVGVFLLFVVPLPSVLDQIGTMLLADRIRMTFISGDDPLGIELTLTQSQIAKESHYTYFANTFLLGPTAVKVMTDIGIPLADITSLIALDAVKLLNLLPNPTKTKIVEASQGLIGESGYLQLIADGDREFGSYIRFEIETDGTSTPIEKYESDPIYGTWGGALII